MSIYPLEVFTIDRESLIVDTNELSRRLLVDKDFDTSAFDDVIRDAHSRISPKCVYIRVPVNLCGNDVCNLGFTTVKSQALHKNLSGCDEAFVFAVTLGFEADRHLLKLSKTSASRFFISDGYYSAAVEGACDAAQEKIKGALNCKPRFSPGYGDLPLEIQKDVLSALDASRLLGITLADSLLMTPQKSVTAIMGIVNPKGM